MIEKYAKPKFIIGAILVAPIAIMFLAKFYTFISHVLFPCDDAISYCDDIAPTLLTMFTVFGLAVYIVIYTLTELDKKS